ncbi:hypothetical protein M758_2G208600 [Ceratodon purpureus]|nr:hypothetical protein M758_2G208600 [Ceratodon purpureus]
MAYPPQQPIEAYGTVLTGLKNAQKNAPAGNREGDRHCHESASITERDEILAWLGVRSSHELTDMKEVGSGTKTCKRCKSSFAVEANSSSACRFHPTYFVSRRHDDQKRYYELGPDDPPYAAKFWDCCGSEDPEAEGCKTSFHVSYDEG